MIDQWVDPGKQAGDEDASPAAASSPAEREREIGS